MIDNIKKKALENHIPIIMDDTLEVVSKILEKVRPKNILEIGTAVGYSAICFSEYLADSGCIDTIERDEQRAKEAIENIKKVKYPFFLEQALRLINKDGIIIADNVLYKGYVLGDYNKHKQRTAVRNLREYISKITNDPNIETQILEVGDGLAISRII